MREAACFVAKLKRALARRGPDVPFLAHDLVAEMHGHPAPGGDFPRRPAQRG